MASKRVVAALLLLACLAAVHGAAARSLQQAQVSFGTAVSGDRHYADNLTLADLRGVWYGEGDQIPYSVREATTAGTLPNCSAHIGEFDYSHYNPYDDHYTVLYSHSNATLRVTAGHSRSSYTTIVAYNTSARILNAVNPNTNAVTCTYWKPYVHLPSGLLKAESISRSLFMVNASGGIARQSLNCQVTGNEEPGCYERTMAQLAGVVSAASVQPGSKMVESVSRATYVCLNGECLKFAPKYQVEDHDH